MDCYSCGLAKATLRCPHCDSATLRFCSHECGREATADHIAMCYNRNDVSEVEEHLYDAISEMQDEQAIEDAIDVASELYTINGDVDAEALKEAHEIIQDHLEVVGFELIQAGKTTKKKRRSLFRRKKTSSPSPRRQRAKARAEQRRSQRASRKQERDTYKTERATARNKRKQARYARKADTYGQRLQPTTTGN